MYTDYYLIKPGNYLLLAVIVAGIIFVTDIIIPLGVAFGVPYIIVILITLQSRNRHAVIIAAVITTLLVLLGLVFSPEGGEAWKVNFNRAIAIVAIWIVALLILINKKTEERLLEKGKYISLMENISAAASESNNIDETIKIHMDMICSYTGWPIGHYYVLSNDGTMDLVPTGIWHLEQPERFETFRKVTEMTRFKPGIGLPGRVLSCGEPQWIVNISRDINFPRAKLAEDIGIGSAYAFPIKVGKDIVGVLEFFSGETSEPDLEEQKIMDYFCVQLGRVIEHKQAGDGLRMEKENAQNYLDLASAMLVAINDKQEITLINKKGCEILGYGEHEIIGKNWFDNFVPERLRVEVREVFESLMRGEIKPVEFYENPVLIRSGEEKMIAWHNTILSDGEGRIIGTLGSGDDITENKQTEEELRKLSRAVEYSSAAVVITGSDGNIEYVNPKFTKITGYTREEVIGENPRLLKSGETSENVYVELWETITSGGEWKGKFHNRKKDGSLYWALDSISGVKDVNGEITHYIAIQEDVTHEYELSEQLGYQANHDALTGLVNRYEFERRAERLLSSIRQDKGEHALCFMDLDQFKVVNDTCGHTAGDEMLRQLSMILQQEVRKRDTLARLGGDEFGVLMEHCTLEKARRVATSLQKAVQDYQFSWEGHSFRVGVSIGLVLITEAMPNLTELMKQADAACYMAKDMGRNRIHVYHGEDQDLVQRHGEMQWVGRIHQALEEDRFCLYAQPIVQLNGHTDEHYELLIRMKDESGEFILPGAFLPAAERYNLIVQLDRWVIENALTLLIANPVFLERIQFFSINLSGQSLADESFLDFIVSQLDASGIERNKICFEITETAAISNLSSAIKFISTLKGLGCRFALDDFGSGLSSFGYLKNLPVDYLKIDGMFVKDMVDNPIDHEMVKSINDIGHVMGMQTIAEFVENDEIKGMLREIGVNYAQGYGIGKPLSFDELLGRSNNVAYIKDAKSNKGES